MKFVVWFEPERVHAGTWLAEKHPEWVLGGKQGGLLNLGHAEARTWLTDHVDRLLTEQGIDLYRQDFNMDPLGYWRGHDAPDRQGITEIRHVEGYLAYWDELRRRHPDMPIDTCASGGRRNDLETLRRAVPLLRSDYRFEPVGTQGHTYGMAQWIPYFGTGVSDTNDYVVRSHWCPWLGIGRDRPQREGLDWTEYHRMVGQWRRVCDYMLGDYYPLTPYSLDNTVWMAWQFDRPELGEGMVQVFRRGESPYESARFPLRGLEPDAQYTLTDLDSGRTQQLAGRQLMQEGLVVTIPQRPHAAVLLYEKSALPIHPARRSPRDWVTRTRFVPFGRQMPSEGKKPMRVICGLLSVLVLVTARAGYSQGLADSAKAPSPGWVNISDKVIQELTRAGKKIAWPGKTAGVASRSRHGRRVHGHSRPGDLEEQRPRHVVHACRQGPDRRTLRDGLFPEL